MTVYDQLVTLIAAKLPTNLNHKWATEIVDEILAAKQTQSCPTGCFRTWNNDNPGDNVCPTCQGAGVVVGTEPLIILGPVQVGEATPTKLGEFHLVNQTGELTARGYSNVVPVYRRTGSPDA